MTRVEPSDEKLLSRRNVAALACVEIAGFAVRAIGAGGPLNGDEHFSFAAADGSRLHLFQVAMYDRTHTPLHLILLHIWTHIFGASIVAARSLSIVFSILFLFFVWKITRQSFSFFAALIASAICALSPFFIHYGLEVRPYSLVAMLSVISLDLMLGWVRNPQSLPAALLYTVIATCLILAHPPGAAFVAAEIAILIILYRFPLATLLIFPMALLPSAEWYVLSGVVNTNHVSDLIGWIAKPKVLDVLSLPRSFLGEINLPRMWLLIDLLAVLPAWGLISGFVRQNGETKKRLIAITALSLSVPVSLYVLSFISKTSFWATRQMIGSAACAAILVAIGISYLPAKVRIGSFALFLGLAGLDTYLTRPAAMGPDWRQIATDIQKRYPGRPLIAPESWPAEPLSTYTTKPVEASLTVQEKDLEDHAIFICQPYDCSGIDSDGRLKLVLAYNDSRWTDTTRVSVFDEK